MAIPSKYFCSDQGSYKVDSRDSSLIALVNNKAPIRATNFLSCTSIISKSLSSESRRTSTVADHEIHKL